jgi:5'-nucleotidase
VLIAVNSLLESPPDFVFSGVNHGPNMGEDVLYSGTVAAAMEGTILGIPSVAVSFASRAADRLRGYADALDGPAEAVVTHYIRQDSVSRLM